MLYLIIILLFTPPTSGKTAAELCGGTSRMAQDGNWYCSAVTAITYRNIGQPGAYNRTTVVDPNTGLCGHETVQYSPTDPLAPLLGELSMHLRGPMNVSQIAVYTLQSTVGRRRTQDDVSKVFEYHEKYLPERHETPILSDEVPTVSALYSEDLVVRHSIKSHPPPRHYTPKSSVTPTATCTPTPCITRTVTTTTFVTATNCVMVCPALYAQPTSTPPSVDLSPSPSPSQQGASQSQAPCTCDGSASNDTITSSPTNWTNYTALVPSSVQAPLPSTLITLTRPATSTSASPLEARQGAAWRRVAYYTSSAPAEATGISFLANLGDPQRSGTFDYSFGNSLSYVTPDGRRVSAQPSPFSGNLRTSELEMSAFTDRPCGQDCEYWRPDSTAYHGWGGVEKAFFIQFQMDHYDNVGSEQGLLSDAPAWWFLNAAIPRILQYGNDKNNIPCSCWSTGCGEFDAFEVLGRGEERAKSTIHRQGNLEGGDSNYFRRPVGRMLKFAVVFHNFNITAVVLPDNFDFARSLTMDAINSLIAYDPNSNTHSLFPIGD